MENEIDKNCFKYVGLKSINFDIKEKIKDDFELLRFIDVYDTSTKVIYYKDTPIGFKCETSYGGVPEFQYALFKEFRGMGFANYLLEDFKRRKFEENYRAVTLFIDKENIKSIKAAQKNGFIMDDRFEEFNSENKEDTYFKFYAYNPNYVAKRGR